MSEKDQAVIETAKARQERDRDDVVTLSTGVRVKIKSVSPSLLAEVTGRVKYPKVPTYFNEAKGREEENEAHPDYIAAVNQANEDKGVAMMDALVMFGVELLDPIPDNGWAEKLRLLGVEFDPDNEVEREFYYKKHVAVTVIDFDLLKDISGVTAKGVSRAEESFRRSKTRAANKQVSNKK